MGLPCAWLRPRRRARVARRSPQARCRFSCSRLADRSELSVAGRGRAVFFFLAPDRLPKLVTLLSPRPDRRSSSRRSRGGPRSTAAWTPRPRSRGQRAELIILVVCVGVALVQPRSGSRRATATARLAGGPRVHGRRVATSRRRPVAVAAGLPGEISDSWDEFKGRGAGRPCDESARRSPDPQRVGATSSGSRPSTPTRPSRDGDRPGHFRVLVGPGRHTRASSATPTLYLETLAELGIVGLVLIVGFSCVLIRARFALRAPQDCARPRRGRRRLRGVRGRGASIGPGNWGSSRSFRVLAASRSPRKVAGTAGRGLPRDAARCGRRGLRSSRHSRSSRSRSARRSAP